MENYEKLVVLFNLAIKMQESAEGMSIYDIQDFVGCSRRTAERMRSALERAFPQMEEITDNHVKHWYIPQRTLNSMINFSAEELAVFKTAVDALRKRGMTDNANLLDGISYKLHALLKSEHKARIEPDAEALMNAEGLALRPGPKVVVDEDVISKIREAILSLHQIKIAYLNRSGKVSRNTLMPYGILYGDRNHYLLARHSDGYAKGDLRYFILNNIQNIEILSDTYNISADFNLEKFAERSFGVFQEDPFEVEWLFDEYAAPDAKRFTFHPTQEVIENPDGTLTVKFKAGGRREMDWHLYTWGNHVKVIKPDDWYSHKLEDMYAKK